MPKITYDIPAMDCPAEEALIRNRFKSLSDVQEIGFDLFNRRLTVTHTYPDDKMILAALSDIGMNPQTGQKPKADGSCCTHDHSHAHEGHAHDGHDHADVQIHQDTSPNWALWALGLSGVLAFSAEGMNIAGWGDTSIPVIAVALASILLGGLPTLKKGLIALRTFTLNINFLMTVAVLGAMAVGSWPEAAMVIFLFALAELIEAYSLDRARNAVRGLMALTPETATVQNENNSWNPVPVDSVQTGTIVRVKPGERIPLDGLVTSGTSSVDQAPITGESIPVDKAPGDQVFAGTVNGNGLLELKTTGGKDQTTIARIIRSVQEAQGQRAPTQRFVDNFARYYTPVVVVIAIVIAIAPWAIFGQPFLPWLYNALVLLVIACPCALVISTPVTVVSALAAAAKHGILIKGGVFLEGGRKLKVIALDKTGTITEGKPKLTDVSQFKSGSGSLTVDEVLRIAASLDSLSDHPVARAVSSGWDPVKGQLHPVTDFESVVGRGVQGKIDNQMYHIGNHRWAHEKGVCSPALESALGELESMGKTAIVLFTENAALGVLAVADTTRETSAKAISDLHALGLRTIMLTGDNQKTADAIAKAVAIDDIRGSLLPEDKLTAIDELIAKYGPDAVGMVGDGVNDAPALAKAGIGFAMGSAGTDTAIETADVAFMKDDLRALPEFIRLSRKTSSILVQNITFALTFKAIFFGLALFGMATLWMAVIADMGASLLVVANGLRLLRYKNQGL
jgi:Zn2+/Cd2+-exporting ATPase